MSRPEKEGPADLYYNEKEAAKYANNSRIRLIQAQLADRAIDLLALPPNQSCLLLDIGCGSGLSGECISNRGHHWVGCDISPSMLDIAVQNGTEGDVMLRDMGQGLPFRTGMFDGAISISAVQWLCYSNSKNENPIRRLNAFFMTLFNSLRSGGKAVIQLYPETPEQMELISKSAMKCGFVGGLVVDYPNSAKAKKMYLVLKAGNDPNFTVPKGLTDETASGAADDVRFTARDKALNRRKRGREFAPIKSKEWIMKKKEKQQAEGRKTARDSKYTGRRRPAPFYCCLFLIQ